MSQLTISQIIKIIIAVFIIAVVVLSVYLAFKNYIIPYFEGIGFGSSKLILSLLG